MASVGTLTTVRTETYRDYETRQPKRVTVIETMWLHPTKGWRRGQKTKFTEDIRLRDLWPIRTFKRAWKRS